MIKEKLEKIQIQENSYECSVTADVAVFGFQENVLKILLIKRLEGHFQDHWLLPGGALYKNETIEDCAKKVLFTLTGLEKIHYQQVKVYSDQNRHPVKRVITISFYAIIQPDNHPLSSKSGIASIDWFALEKLPKNIGYDHHKIILDAHALLKQNLEEKFIFGELLPERFTLSELQILYENILNIKLDKRNFRKKIIQKNVLINTGEKKQGIKGGPLLYCLK